MSPPAATYMRPGAGLFYIIYAGTGMCVHIPFRLNPIASLAWLGNQPCNIAKFYISTDGTDTHTCSEISYRITDVECISRAQTLQLNLTGLS